ncbi:Thioredoxin [Gracilariopsis chorda]|uniref:Thioredoxin n=1 Tax=Gracilariopsis chorda TaxID=448386 RepID=A0A2V3IF93_9FLOR|nr:Thioredoxin [Gracilariopsis chorda]|eukprot:PXF40756.1 Thioredoxin [Gracilariopsis chorda]
MVSEIQSGEHFSRAISSKPVVVVDFFATWCGPCKKMEPVLRDWEEGMAENGEDWMVRFVKVNVDHHSRIAQSYQVTAMPTFVVFLNGEAKYTVRGARKRELRERIESAMQVASDERNARSRKN